MNTGIDANAFAKWPPDDGRLGLATRGTLRPWKGRFCLPRALTVQWLTDGLELQLAL